MQQAMYDTPQRAQELSDAEIARKLQEEELLVSGVISQFKGTKVASGDYLTLQTFSIW